MTNEELIEILKKPLGEREKRKLIKNETFKRLCLQDIEIQQVIFDNATFIDCNFQNVKITSVDFKDSKLEKITFERSTIMGVDFNNCIMQDVKIQGCRMLQTSIWNSYIAFTKCERSLLYRCSIRDNSMINVAFSQCEIVKSSFCRVLNIKVKILRSFIYDSYLGYLRRNKFKIKGSYVKKTEIEDMEE